MSGSLATENCAWASYDLQWAVAKEKNSEEKKITFTVF